MSKLKAFDFVSTLGVTNVDPAAAENEDAVLVESLSLGDGYAEGYSKSKWAGEVLLRKANEELGVPVNVLRGNSMMAHQRYVGQINEIDFFTRILYSVIAAGVAPDSFIERAQDGSKQTAHYDGTPVDVVAASVVAAANFNHRDFRAFNMANYLEDDCSWDTFVDELEALGYPISRIEDYSDWHSRTVEKLQNLTDAQKQHSAIDVMSGYAQPRKAGGVTLSTKNYQELVSTQSTDGEIKHLDPAFARKTILDIKAKGWIDDRGAI